MRLSDSFAYTKVQTGLVVQEGSLVLVVPATSNFHKIPQQYSITVHIKLPTTMNVQ